MESNQYTNTYLYENTRKGAFKKGLSDGIPICLGYLAVSFSFGILARTAGISPMQAVLMSATNLTSAGQFAAISLITSSASYMEMAITQFIINLRYCLMSCALSQKLDSRMPFRHRFFIAAGISDEIFGVSIAYPEKLNPFYSYGVMSLAIPGWTLGTFLGTISGNILPDRIMSALNVALYGMFIAVIVPPAKTNKVLAVLIMISMLISYIVTKIPLISGISSGFKIIILTVVIAGIAAALFPVQAKEEENNA